MRSDTVDGMSAALLPGAGRNQSLARAFLLLECLADQPDGASVATLARRIGLPRATVTRLLASLADQGAVARVGRTRDWVLGPAIVRLARAVAPLVALSDRARPLLEAAVEDVGETVMLGVPIGPASAQVVDEVPGPRVVGVGSWLGRTLTHPASGFVRILLAELPDEDLRRVLAGLRLTAFTPKTITDEHELLAAIEEVRRDGCCLVVDELETGLAGMAVAVRREGRVVAMVAMYLPTARFDAAKRAHGRARLTALAERLEAELERG
jgi:IclR family acetate operon transcriptional repressor